jgi:hypothetical protein
MKQPIHRVRGTMFAWVKMLEKRKDISDNFYSDTFKDALEYSDTDARLKRTLLRLNYLIIRAKNDLSKQVLLDLLNKDFYSDVALSNYI